MIFAGAAAVERDEAVVVAAVLVDEGDDAGCRLTHVRVMMLVVLASCIYRLDIISPCLAETPIRPLPECVYVTVGTRFLVVIIKRGRLPLTEPANSPTTLLALPIVCTR